MPFSRVCAPETHADVSKIFLQGSSKCRSGSPQCHDLPVPSLQVQSSQIPTSTYPGVVHVFCNQLIRPLGKQDKVAYFIKYLLKEAMFSPTLGLPCHPYWGGWIAAETLPILGSACAVSLCIQGISQGFSSSLYMKKRVLTKVKMRSLE